MKRRTFLKAMGGVSAALPLLHAGRARAAAPKRFLVVSSPNGMYGPEFWPRGSGSDLKTMTFPKVTKSLERHASKLIFPGGLDYHTLTDGPSSDGHSSFALMLNGAIAGYSSIHPNGAHLLKSSVRTLDHRIADRINATTALKFPILNVGIQTHDPGDWGMSYFGDKQPAPRELNPYALYQRLFSGLGVTAPEIDKLKAENKSILDLIGKSIDRVKVRLGSEDRSRIEQHLGAIRSLEQSLVLTAGAACEKPAVPKQWTTAELENTRNYPQILAAQTKNIVMAFACDLTRVATIQWDDDSGNRALPWLGGRLAEARDCDIVACNTGEDNGLVTHHGVAHGEGKGPEGDAMKIAIDSWYMEQLADLLNQLDAIPEGDGTLLDNTCVLYANCMSHGSHPTAFTPFVMAGGAGGALKTGQLLRFGDFTAFEASGYKSRGLKTAPHQGMLTAIANAFDMNLDFMDDPKYGGELPGFHK